MAEPLDIVQAARKVAAGGLRHAYGCIGPLSELSCRCGLSDLLAAVRREQEQVVVFL